jgi:hypothetical protein
MGRYYRVVISQPVSALVLHMLRYVLREVMKGLDERWDGILWDPDLGTPVFSRKEDAMALGTYNMDRLLKDTLGI